MQPNPEHCPNSILHESLENHTQMKSHLFALIAHVWLRCWKGDHQTGEKPPRVIYEQHLHHSRSFHVGMHKNFDTFVTITASVPFPASAVLQRVTLCCLVFV